MFNCPKCAVETPDIDQKVYLCLCCGFFCAVCNVAYTQYEICFGSKPPPGVPMPAGSGWTPRIVGQPELPGGGNLFKPGQANRSGPPWRRSDDDFLQPARVPKKPKPSGGDTSNVLKLPIKKDEDADEGAE